MSNTDMDRTFSERGFAAKVAGSAKKAGAEVIEKALTLYYVASDDRTPAWIRGYLFSALGYFMTPLDAIADFTPVAGFSDDLSVLSLALAAAVAHIKEEHREQARHQRQRWLGAGLSGK